ncbi:MAG: hypothetical protein ACYTFD_12445 [Planctomycetota bacterium]
MWRFCLSLVASVALGGCFDSCAVGDKVTLCNAAGHEVGLLVDGTDQADARVEDDRVKTASSSVVVGPYKGHHADDKILGFTYRRPVTEVPAPWTPEGDDVAVSFPDEIEIEVTVWIVKGPFDTQRDHVYESLLHTITLFEDERMGVTIKQPFDIRDATTNGNASNHHDFKCTAAKRKGLQKEISGLDVDDPTYKPDRLHIYYVDTVDGLTDNGQACGIGTDFCVLGKDAAYHLLAHEIAHTMALNHINNPEILGTAANPAGNYPGFDETNVMHAQSDTREYFTEGQTYRAHFHSNSCLNDIYAARPDGRTSGTIPANVATAVDPPLRRRIWKDGSWAPE